MAESSLSTTATGKHSSSTLSRLKKFDEERPNFPGEHLIVFAVGSLLMLKATRSRSILGRGIMMAAGAALLGRAASGEGGIAKIARGVSKLR